MAYNSRYAEGVVWDYEKRADQENYVIRELVVRPTGLTDSKARCLEVGCGQGWHANALRKRGLLVTAVDQSPAAILHAKQQYQFASLDFLCRDAIYLTAEFVRERFAMLYCRGLSWHHYSLTDEFNECGINPVEATQFLVSLLNPRCGFFCLQIATDFSGKQETGKVHNNTLKSYITFMANFGKIIHCSDWLGAPLDKTGKKKPKGAHGGIIITVRV